MDEHAPSPQTTLAILLGASAWPYSPDFHGSEAFVNVARDFKAYLLDSQHFGLPEENLLDLFDTEQGPDKIDRAMRSFLEERTSALQQAGKAPRDLLFYFVGHGGFAGRKSEYYLAVRCTSSENPGASGIRIESLATTLTDRARYLRRFIILDCCYAAAAFTAFQAEGPAQVAARQVVDVFKEKARRAGKGTALLCSSGKKVTSLLTPDGNATMFSKALLQVLTTSGNPHRPDRAYLSLYEVADLVEEALDQLLAEKAPRPELHSPDQVEGDIAEVPFFPNPAAVGRTLTSDTLVEPVRRDLSNGQLGNYRLVRLLGEGGFAEVYLGEHVHLGTQAAIKVLRTQLTQSDVESFRDEARIIAHLNHPHIVRVLDYGVENKTPFLVMSYAADGSLRQLHPKGTRLPLPTIVTYVNQVADALQYAHQQKLIHRDVKPENMLMGRHNEVLLSDFGIAVIAHSTSSLQVEAPAGTFAYTAPEQLRGQPRPASDQYSLGVVVYEWLCGERPFQGSLTEMAYQHAMMPPPSLRQKGIEIPPEVEQVVMIALAKKPEERFASVGAFAHALEQACLPNSPTVPVPGPSPMPPKPKPPLKLSRRAALVGGISLASLAVVGGSFAVLPPLTMPARGTVLHTLSPGDTVYAVAWSPDGTYLAAASNAEGVWVWDASSGAYVLTYTGHASGTVVGAVAWSPDGKYIASGGSDATVQVWEALTRRKIINIQTGHSGSTKVVNAVAWSPDGKYLVSAGEDGNVKVWDARTGYPKYTYKGHIDISQDIYWSVNAVAWSPDGTRIASASDDSTVQVWNAANGHPVFTYRGHAGAVQAVAWSPDSTHIASGSADQTVQVWLPSQSAPATKYSGHSDVVDAVAWSSNGQHLASGSVDKTVRIWDLSTNGTPYIYREHSEAVYTVAWSPAGFPWPWSHEGQRLASGGKDTIVRLWQAV